MVRFGKCKKQDCDEEIHHVSWGNHIEGVELTCDGIGVCKGCGKEYPLDYVGRNTYLTLRKLKGD